MNLSDGENEKRSKRKHITLTIQEKLDIINLVESNAPKCSRQFIATKYGIGKSTVHDIHKRRDQIRKFAMKNNTDLSKRRRVNVGSTMYDECFVEQDEDEEQFEISEEKKEDEENVEVIEEDGQLYEIIYETQVEPSEQKIQPKSNKNGKRRSNTLTIRQKYEILKQLEEGKSVPMICACYSIGRTTVYDFIKRRKEIIDYIEKSSDETRKTFKRSNYPEVEASISEWCENNDFFTKQHFFEKCKANFAKINTSSHFCGSWSWCKRFFDRHPHFKCKLIKSDGEPVFKSNASISKDDDRLAEYTSIGIELDADYISEEDYIVEELEPDETSQETLKGEEEEQIIEVFEEPEVSEQEAIDSLNVLLKYCQQKDNPDLMSLLLNCKEYFDDIEIS